MRVIPDDGPPVYGRDRIEELRGVLERAVARACPPWLADRREDIVQTALIRIIETLDRGEGKGIRSASYLWRVGYHATLDEIRRLRRRPEERMDPLELDGAVASNQPGPDRAYKAREIGRAIHDCLARLVRPRRLAVQLMLYGYDLNESARVLRWSSKRTDNLRYRGLADLRRCLKEKGIEP